MEKKDQRWLLCMCVYSMCVSCAERNNVMKTKGRGIEREEGDSRIQKASQIASRETYFMWETAEWIISFFPGTAQTTSCIRLLLLILIHFL